MKTYNQLTPKQKLAARIYWECFYPKGSIKALATAKESQYRKSNIFGHSIDKSGNITTDLEMINDSVKLFTKQEIKEAKES